MHRILSARLSVLLVSVVACADGPSGLDLVDTVHDTTAKRLAVPFTVSVLPGSRRLVRVMICPFPQPLMIKKIKMENEI
jgi:hypothetical protein